MAAAQQILQKEMKAGFLLDAQRRESQVLKGVEEPKYKAGISMSASLFQLHIPTPFHS